VRERQDGTRSHSEPVRPRVSGFQAAVTERTWSVAAHIVSYNSGPEMRLTHCSVLPQVSTVFVIDNASDRESGLAHTELCAEPCVAPVGLVQQLMRGVDRLGRAHLAAVLCLLCIGSDPSGHQSAVPDADIAVESCMNAGSIAKLAAWKPVGSVERHIANLSAALVRNACPVIMDRDLEETLSDLAKPSRYV